MDDEIISLEDVYLSELVRKGRQVNLIFVNGYQTPAVIQDFDDKVIVAMLRNKECLIYRHAISTIELSVDKG